MEKKKPVSFKLFKVTTEQFAILGDPPQTEEGINVNTGINFGYVKDDSVIASFVKLQFNAKDTPFIIIEAACHFKVLEQDWESFRDKENNSIILPKGFASHLIMLTIGTIRGILHTKTENTPLNRFIVPLINVTEMINSDIILKNTED